MIYVALLRGINVGGNNKIAMAKLVASFEKQGMDLVSSYINSGNIIFRDITRDATQIVKVLEKAIQKDFDLSIKVLVRSWPEIRNTIQALPDHWQNNTDMKCDVMFLWESVDTPQVIDQLTIKPDIDDVLYTPGAILWRVDRSAVTRSGMLKLVGTPLYKQMTIRNCNTLRKLYDLMEKADASS